MMIQLMLLQESKLKLQWSHVSELHAMNLKLLQLVLSNDDDNDDLELGQLSCFKGGLSTFLVKTSSNPRPLWTVSK